MFPTISCTHDVAWVARSLQAEPLRFPYLHNFRRSHLADRCSAQALRRLSALDRLDLRDLNDFSRRSATVGSRLSSPRPSTGTVWSVGTCHCKTTGMSSILSENSNCAISTGFWASVVAQQRADQQPCPRSTTVKSPRGSAQSGPWPPVVEQQRACPRSATVESPRAALSGPQQQSLTQPGPRVGNWRITAVCCAVCPVGTCLSLEIGTVAVGKTVVAAVLAVTGDA